MYKCFAGKTLRISTLIISIFFIFSQTVFSNESTADSLVQPPSHASSRENLIRGERLFYGLVYRDAKSVDCQSCHNTRYIDTVNWNPNAFEIAAKYKDKSVKDLSNALLRPRSEKMKEVHKGIDLSEEDIVQIKDFMDDFAGKGLKTQKTTLNKLILFIIVSFFFFVFLIDLTIIKKIKYHWLHFLVLLGGGIYLTNSLVTDALAIGRSQGYSPDQPIKFSHKVHAGQNKTDCIYCHSSAETSKSAGIPSDGLCMNCHLIVRNGTRSGAFEIAKVVKAYEEGKPIEWVRIHNLPDHAYFNHSQHVKAAGLACKECHGPIEEMDRVRQVSDLSMGWCISCHRQKQVDFHDNKFYEVYRDKVEKIKKGEIDSITVEMIGGTECMKCHY